MPSSNTTLEKLTIGVTDSGLGGLSVAAQIADTFARQSPATDVHVVFLNCKPSDTMGFKHLDHARRCRVLTNVLDCLDDHFGVDVTLVACNTLSVLLDQLQPRKGQPVIGIVAFGVQAIVDELTGKPDTQIVLMGTPSTIESKQHRKQLTAQGIDESRLFDLACPGLEMAIEREFGSQKTTQMINDSVASIAPSLDANKPIAVALLCTHYPYAAAHIIDAFAKQGFATTTIINPNDAMASQFASSVASSGSRPANVTIEFVSQSAISTETRSAIGRLIQPICQSAAAALADVKVVPDLFDIA